ncbi:hypothetical protein DFAR_3460043 [Desulfarculales bacterium]
MEIVSLAPPATLRAGVLGFPVGSNLQENFVGLLIDVHTLPHQPSGQLHNPRPRAKNSPAPMIASYFNSAMRIAAAGHQNYTNSTHDDEETDYAGQTVDVVVLLTGEIRVPQIFVTVLSASTYTFAEVTWTQGLPD